MCTSSANATHFSLNNQKHFTVSLNFFPVEFHCTVVFVMFPKPILSMSKSKIGELNRGTKKQKSKFGTNCTKLPEIYVIFDDIYNFI